MAPPSDPWKSGEPYEFFMGRWSRPVACEFLNWLSAAPARRRLDVGCGIGALSSLILQHAAPTEILAVDQSDTFVTFGQQTIKDPCLKFKQGDAQYLPTESNYYNVVVFGLALNFIPNPAAAVAQMIRSVKPGGTIAIYVWDYAEICRCSVISGMPPQPLTPPQKS